MAAALRAGASHEDLFRLASDRLRGDEALVTLAVTRNGNNLKHASEAMKANRSVVMCAVAEWGLALKYASQERQDDRDIVLQAAKTPPYGDGYEDEGPLTFASERLRADYEIALSAMRVHGWSLELLSAEMRDNEAIVRAAHIPWQGNVPQLTGVDAVVVHRDLAAEWAALTGAPQVMPPERLAEAGMRYQADARAIERWLEKNPAWVLDYEDRWVRAYVPRTAPAR